MLLSHIRGDKKAFCNACSGYTDMYKNNTIKHSHISHIIDDKKCVFVVHAIGKHNYIIIIIVGIII